MVRWRSGDAYRQPRQHRTVSRILRLFLPARAAVRGGREPARPQSGAARRRPLLRVVLALHPRCQRLPRHHLVRHLHRRPALGGTRTGPRPRPARRVRRARRIHSHRDGGRGLLLAVLHRGAGAVSQRRRRPGGHRNPHRGGQRRPSRRAVAARGHRSDPAAERDRGALRQPPGGRQLPGAPGRRVPSRSASRSI